MGIEEKIRKLSQTFQDISKWRDESDFKIAPQPFPKGRRGEYEQDPSFPKPEDIPDVKGKKWEDIKSEAYAPPQYTTKKILGADGKIPSYADKDAEAWKGRGCFNRVFDPNNNDENSSQIPEEGENGLPLNPMGPAGIKGRGCLGQFGANQAADPVVLYISRNGDLKMITVKRNDSEKQGKNSSQEAFPGGMLDPEESGLSASARELAEEAGIDLKDFFQKNGIFLGAGANGDPRNTDNAWMETRMYSVIAETMGKLTAGDDAEKAHWHTVSAQMLRENMQFASHGKMFAVCSDKINKQLTAHLLKEDILSLLPVKNIKPVRHSIVEQGRDLEFTVEANNGSSKNTIENALQSIAGEKSQISMNPDNTNYCIKIPVQNLEPVLSLFYRTSNNLTNAN